MKNLAIFLSLTAFLFSLPAFAEEKAFEEVTKTVLETQVPGEPPIGEKAVIKKFEPYVPAEMEEGTVTRVVDADTIEIDGVRMGLMGISAPERWWWKEPRECFSAEASTWLEEAILNKDVRYAFDPIERRRSRPTYRIYLYLGDRLINAEMIANGFAFAERARQYVEKDRFIEMEGAPKLHQIGFWHRCPVECVSREKVCRTKNW